MQAEIIALRHQLTVLQRSQKPRRLVLNRCDRCLWVWLSRLWSGWRSSLMIVKPAHPTAEWTAQQIPEAFPFNTAPKYLLRDRHRIYGQEFHDQVAVMNINEVLGARQSPWQRPYVERVIGSIRRECLDHMIVFDEDSLRRTLRSYFSYYRRSGLHLSIDKDSPDPRPVRSVGKIIACREVGGLHHRYDRVA